MCKYRTKFRPALIHVPKRMAAPGLCDKNTFESKGGFQVKITAVE
jgi:hypothetical protein